METKDIAIKMRKGMCNLSRIKANSIAVNSDSGDIECGDILQGNIDLYTSKGVSILTANLLT